MFGLDLASVTAGGAAVGLVYFVYLCATKGLPAALTWLKTKWSAGRTELANLAGELDDAHSRIDSAIESVKAVAQGLGQTQARLANLENAFADHLAQDAAAAHPKTPFAVAVALTPAAVPNPPAPMPVVPPVVSPVQQG